MVRPLLVSLLAAAAPIAPARAEAPAGEAIERRPGELPPRPEEPPPSAPPPLARAELRIGYGAAFGGGAGAAAIRTSPLDLAAIGEYAIVTEPAISTYAGLVLETIGRVGVGGVLGVRLRPPGSAFRLSAGGAAFLFPYTLIGPTAAVGMCGSRSIAPCLEIEGSFFVGGSDVPDDRVAGQLLMNLGVSFHAM